MKEFAFIHNPTANFSPYDRHFLEALTRWNYFPNQKESATELPPNISTRRYTPEIAKKLLQEVALSKDRRTLGFDLVEYRATRYNNVSRILGLIHPLAYAQIFGVMESNRDNLVDAMNDDNSAISVEAHNDGRMLIMNYEDPETKALTAADQSFGKKFRAHTDIANCFGSVYTHSLEWATQGFETAKANLTKKGARHWSTDLDQVLRGAKRNETSGLPIGPASSSIAVEVILAAVDRKLREQFSFVRYVDDYTALCQTHAEAEEFIRLLGKELSQYRLTLNLSKTSIVELPEPLQEKWVSTLMSALPPLLQDDGQLAFMSTREAFHFLDYAVRLNNETPDGSVIKFAVSTIARRLKDRAAADVFQYVLNLSWHYPILLPYLEKIDARSDYYDTKQLENKLNGIIETNALHRRSDGICWALYYLERLNSLPSEKSISAIIESKDCVALAMLCNFENSIDAATQYAQGIIGAHIYTQDQNWLLLYQLFLADKISDPYPNEETFTLLKKYDVDFFCSPGKDSHAETYCIAAHNPFVQDDERPSFDQWMNNL
ncbi:antiviral reverse transcriptase Drt4 [Pseudomonas sp. GM67]|uniref:antiviral reverse transcriptase Drt4 n=1 Tax=Pseudomonas sp. GM67 TaxID=1144335 RepID=UPI000270C397|nr:antiviral reverse transcriptase Drt4 [Pseudomonas sp. GM67]EJM92485.1 Reverse transcriptase (RNA-dependent DNA polymerase) [Pseudomonas sp. GM67]